MLKTLLNVRFVAMFSLTLAGAACGNDGSSTAPSQPPATKVTVTSVTPALGSIGGGTSVTITGTGFQPGVTVTFDTTTVTARFDNRDAATIFLQAPPHTPGTVDLLVTNPGSQSQRFVGAYTYTVPGVFDFNGDWPAVSFDGSDRALRFTVQNDVLVSATCLGAANEVIPLALPNPPRIVNGEFSVFGDDGVGMSGRMVAETEAVGTMNLPPCTAMQWKTYPKRSR